jgi:hypothetical protein
MAYSTADRMIRARRTAERAAGLLLIERIEAGATLADLTSPLGPIQGGRVTGTDMDPRALVTLCGAASARISHAVRALNA